VIIPFYNAATTVECCVRSLLNQDYPVEDFEIIAIDNNSPDDSASRVQRFERVRLLQERRQGSYAARNTGVQASNGEILAFTDADCIPDSGWLAAIEKRMQLEQVQVMLGPRTYPAARMRLISSYDDAKVEYILNRGDARAYFGFTNNMAVRRNAFDRGGPFELVDRGGDSIFVRTLAVAYGPNAIVWEPAMRVCHLEVQCLTDYFRKNLTYARSRQRTRDFGECRHLNVWDCFRVFRSVTQRSSPLECLSLMLLLGAGRVTWNVGTML
jgi:glycosyltransferase involved in cell wall biosynthesis